MSSWEDTIKWSPKCSMCDTPMDKLNVYTGKNRWNQKIAKFKCPKCGHTEVFK